MNKRQKSLVVLTMPALFLAFIVVFYSSSFAQNDTATNPAEKPDKRHVDSKIYDPELIVDDFLNAALSKHVMSSSYGPLYFPSIEQTEKKEKLKVSLQNPKDVEKYYPWLSPLLYPKGLPRYGAISKWVSPVRISFGLPNDLKPYNLPVYKGKLLSEYDDWLYIRDEAAALPNFYSALFKDPYDPLSSGVLESRTIAESEVRKILPELTRLTGLDVAYIENEGKAKDDPISNVRIVLINKEMWQGDNLFKTGPNTRTSSGPGRTFKGGFEYRFPGASFFSPNGKNRVDGYFVSNERNEIDFAVCYIREGHDSLLLRMLIRECLIRSMGLPDSQYHFEDSLLSPWNDFVPVAGSGVDVDLPTLSGVDQAILGMLYSANVRPSMTYRDIYKIFLRNN